jgi:acetone carboxylase gamma subunit
MDPDSKGGDVGTYDYNNVLNIIEQDNTPGSSENLVQMKTHDLFKEYVTMKHDEVTWSNKLYLTWTAEVWFAQNLKLSFDFLKTHCSEELRDKMMN